MDLCPCRKAFLVQYAAGGLRVVVTTKNAVDIGRERITEALFTQDFPLKDADSPQVCSFFFRDDALWAFGDVVPLPLRWSNIRFHAELGV